MERIAFRDRSYERQMSWHYIDDLRKAYEEFFRDYTQTPVLSLATDDLDIVHNAEDLAEIVQSIRSMLGKGTHQKTLPQMTAASAQPTLDAGDALSRRLSDLQRWHQMLDAERGVPKDLYFDFIRLQGDIGALAHELAEVWMQQERLHDAVGNKEESMQRAIEERRSGLRDELASCLVGILKIANYTSIDLEEACLHRLRSQE
jgi:NTP pyrophosphatase (non-canonical NTP hydrolase)